MFAIFFMAPPALAFCGTYVGPADSTLQNEAAQVVVARDGDQIVLTLAADVSGDERTFALVIPVPEVLTADDVRLASTELFAALDAYTAPRIVAYTCADLRGETDADTDTDTDTDADYDTATGVTVESEFSVGSYDIAVVSAEGADGLIEWLNLRGFSLSGTAGPVVQEYIDAGQHFLAAQVDLEEIPVAASWLAPLQLRYTSAAWTLPIRIGTTVSPGIQDLVVYALSDDVAGISNYPEATIEDECLLPEGTSDYGVFYTQQLNDAFATGIWFTEYAWSPSGCDPCSSEPVSEALLADAGSTNGYAGTVTRLRLRYTPEQATQDLSLYESGSAWSQIRYIAYAPYLQGEFPTCGVGAIPDAPSCDDEAGASETGTGDTASDAKGGACGCSSRGALPATAWAALALVWGRRRRSVGQVERA